MASTANGLMRKVFFSSPDPDLIEEGDEEQEEKKEVVAPTRSELKEASHDQAPNAVALNQQATQLLALKKIEWDLIVVSDLRPRWPTHALTIALVHHSSPLPSPRWLSCLEPCRSGWLSSPLRFTITGTRELIPLLTDVTSLPSMTTSN